MKWVTLVLAGLAMACFARAWVLDWFGGNAVEYTLVMVAGGGFAVLTAVSAIIWAIVTAI